MKLYDYARKPLVDVDTTKEINRGGEGVIYEYPGDPTKVIKVYHDFGTLTKAVVQELMLLPNNFIKPLELFYDRTGRAKGLSMQYLDVHKLHLLASIFNKASATKLGFTDHIKEKIYVDMCYSVLEAHKVGIVIGDLNPYNIFVSTKGEVYFIDVDSFQTKNRAHSGVMLPEIRDWLYSHISAKSDYWALSVMVFNLFTHVHPYKGVHKKIQKLEERVIGRVSLLSGDPDLIIPSFYEPFIDVTSIGEFKDIFHKDQRFLPKVGKNSVYSTAHVAKVATFVTAITEGELTIRTIDVNVEDFDASDNFFYTRKNTDQFIIYTSKAQGTYNKFFTVEVAENCYLGNANVIITQYSKLYNCTQKGLTELTNFSVPMNSFSHYNGRRAIYFDGSNDSYCLLDVDQIFNDTHINFHKGVIYTKSVSVQTGVVQSILGSKWILDITLGNLRTLRTNVNVIDVMLVPSGNYGVLETKNNNTLEYNLFSVKGMRVELGPKLNGMCSIAEKGDYLYMPDNTAVIVYRKSDLTKVANIACKYVNEQSVLKCCNAGILCLTAGVLYLFNKS